MSPPPDAEPEQDQELDRLRRCLAVLLEVLGGTRDGPTALAERFEVAPSTMRRDLSALRKTTGWPLEWDYRGKRWLPGGAVPLLQLPPGATAALCAFAEHLSARDSDEVRGVGTALTSALLAHLDEGASALIERLSRGRSPQVLPVVERALRERSRLRLTYRSRRRGGGEGASAQAEQPCQQQGQAPAQGGAGPWAEAVSGVRRGAERGKVGGCRWLHGSGGGGGVHSRVPQWPTAAARQNCSRL